ncbi:MAG: hypothetical protein H6R26_1278, partial [Proteobacteria bacterium]|nr:hypothetical protein [Pseudomonadota bacterium]
MPMSEVQGRQHQSKETEMTDEPEQTDKRSLMQEMGISDEELAKLKAFLEFGEDDVAELTRINSLAEAYTDPVIDAFYRHLLAFEETRAFFEDPRRLEHVKALQKEYFLDLTRGEY